MIDRNKEVCKKAIDHYGKISQINVAIEEMSELIKELCKYNRGEANKEHIREECADVYIMLQQIQMMFDIEIGPIIDKKVERLYDRIKFAELMKNDITERLCVGCKYVSEDEKTEPCRSCIEGSNWKKHSAKEK